MCVAFEKTAYALDYGTAHYKHWIAEKSQVCPTIPQKLAHIEYL